MASKRWVHPPAALHAMRALLPPAPGWQVVQLLLRDFVEYWFISMADDDEFLLECRHLLQTVLVELSIRYVG